LGKIANVFQIEKQLKSKSVLRKQRQTK